MKLNHNIPYYSNSSATKVKENKEIAQPLKDFGLRISKLLVRTLKNIHFLMLYHVLWLIIYCAVLFQGLDEQQSVQLLQCYLQSDYRGTQQSLKVFVTFFKFVL